MPRVIEVTVKKTGETTVQTKGYSGGACIEASKWLEQSLGISINDHKTAEFYSTTDTEQHIQQG